MALSGASKKSYWKLLNTVLNNSRVPLIPPLLDNGVIVTDYKEDAQIFNGCLIRQYIATDTSYSIQQDPQVVSNPINDFVNSNEEIPDIIRLLNPNRTYCWDEISVKKNDKIN